MKLRDWSSPTGTEDPIAELRDEPAPKWEAVGDYTDIRLELAEGIAKLTICRPEVRNAFRPQTLFELSDAFDRARDDPEVGVVVLTGEGPDAFCSGGDQRIRGDDGYIGDDEVARQGDRSSERARPPDPDPTAPQARRGDGGRLRDRRRPRAAPRVRPDDRSRQRQVRPDRPEGRKLRRWLRLGAAGAHHRHRSAQRRSGSCAASTTRTRRSTGAS